MFSSKLPWLQCSALLSRLQWKTFTQLNTNWAVDWSFHSCNVVLFWMSITNEATEWSHNHYSTSYVIQWCRLWRQTERHVGFVDGTSGKTGNFLLSTIICLHQAGTKIFNPFIVLKLNGNTWAPNNRPTSFSSSFCVHASAMIVACSWTSNVRNDNVVQI